jgi:ADP-heptose:LPS heptosyltransferase
MNPPGRPRALVYRAIGLGDLLTGIPALRALRRALPDHEVVLAAPEVQRPLVELIDAVDRLLPTEELAAVAWSGPPPEIGIDLHGNGPASRTLVASLAPGRLIGYDRSTWDPTEHERVRWCRLITSHLGGEADPDDVLIERPAVPSPMPGAVVVHPGAASGARRWPTERFAAVARWAEARGLPVALTGSPGERDLAVAVRRQAGLPHRTLLAGATDLATLAALVAEASLVICGDTGIAHLASAYATPSVQLFGPMPPALWGPPAGPHTVLWHGTGVGNPHGVTPDRALLKIGVEEVIAAAEERLAAAA